MGTFSFTVTKDPEKVKDSQGSMFINTSGIYDVVIEAAILKTEEKEGNKIQTINLYVSEISGERKQMLYNAFRLNNKDGSPAYGWDKFNHLLIIGDFEDFNDMPTEVVELPIGKGKAMKECEIIPDLTGMPVTLHIQSEWSIYEGEKHQNFNIQKVFHPVTHATASEIVNKVPKKEDDGSGQESYIGKQYEWHEAKADKVVYKDGLTKEIVEEYLQSPNRFKEKGETQTKSSDKKTKDSKFTTQGVRKYGNSK
jgi:hypothetical protein